MDDTRGRLPVDARGKGADADGAAGGATKKAAVGKRNASTGDLYNCFSILQFHMHKAYIFLSRMSRSE